MHSPNVTAQQSAFCPSLGSNVATGLFFCLGSHTHDLPSAIVSSYQRQIHTIMATSYYLRRTSGAEPINGINYPRMCLSNIYRHLFLQVPNICELGGRVGRMVLTILPFYHQSSQLQGVAHCLHQHQMYNTSVETAILTRSCLTICTNNNEYNHSHNKSHKSQL